MSTDEAFYKYSGTAVEVVRERVMAQRLGAFAKFDELRRALIDRLPGGIDVSEHPVQNHSQGSATSSLMGVVLLKDGEALSEADGWIHEGWVGDSEEDAQPYLRPKWNVKGIAPVRRLWEAVEFPVFGGMLLREFKLGNEYLRGESIPTDRYGRLVMRSSVCGLYGDVAVFRVPHTNPVDDRLERIKHSEFIAITEEGTAEAA